ncbi:hypothetical protein MMB17_08135 [Methylobacterium organophilum]|uniref:hypothetical protein n=1 Tax=Methylobacterium organophilum TaxID=410 RepID=UPI001F128DE5|nr:hypothetical protein [Methylobacterium organophilum]UMY19258.1 hypothetical protein MMB17_08135 [Methylobacterium organophilum]
MEILILGGAGQVGTELQAFPWPEGAQETFLKTELVFESPGMHLPSYIIKTS